MNLDHGGVNAYIEEMDKQRHKRTRFLYRIDWEDAHLYDTVSNLEHIDIRSVCDLIIHMAELSAFSMTDPFQQALNDFRLGSKVWVNLAKNKRIRSASINMVAHNGIVTIIGSMGSDWYG